MPLKEMIREFANTATDKAKLMLERDGSLVPVLLEIGKDNLVNPTMVTKVEDVPVLLTMASTRCQAIVFIFDSQMRVLGEGEKPTDGLKKDSTQTLCVMIYHSEGTESKKITYAKSDNGYTFFDMGWTKVTVEDGFRNPFCQ